MSKKTNWSEIDKRIRNRKTSWNADELKELDASLKRLPDLSEQADTLDVTQPALSSGSRNGDEAPN